MYVLICTSTTSLLHDKSEIIPTATLLMHHINSLFYGLVSFVQFLKPGNGQTGKILIMINQSEIYKGFMKTP